jgi:hypothetical protein
MNTLKYMTLMLLTQKSQQAEEKNIEELLEDSITEGRCPYAPGTLPSPNASTFDRMSVLGPW